LLTKKLSEELPHLDSAPFTVSMFFSEEKLATKVRVWNNKKHNGKEIQNRIMMRICEHNCDLIQSMFAISMLQHTGIIFFALQ